MLEKRLLLVDDWSWSLDNWTAHLLEGSLNLILRQSFLGKEAPLSLLRAVSDLVILEEPDRRGDLQVVCSEGGVERDLLTISSLTASTSPIIQTWCYSSSDFQV